MLTQRPGAMAPISVMVLTLGDKKCMCWLHTFAADESWGGKKVSVLRGRQQCGVGKSRVVEVL